MRLEDLTPENLRLVKEYALRKKALEQHKRTNKIHEMYPDEGQFRRELYPKHLSFFKEQATARQLLFTAGNRCVTPWTVIQTLPQPMTALELLKSEGADVLSWDGERQCIARISDAFLKGIEPAFRVTLDNGQVFDCSRKHQLLTSEGYLSLDQIMLQSNGLCSTQTPEDLMASCGLGDYQYGRQPHQPQGTALKRFPLSGDALKHDLHDGFRFVDSVDEVERISEYTHVYQAYAPLSSPCDQNKLLDLIGKFEDPKIYSDALQKFCLQKVVEQFQPVLPPHLSIDAKDYHQSFLDVFLFLKSLYAENKIELDVFLNQTDQRFVERYELNALKLSDHDNQRMEIFFPFEHPELFDGVKILSVQRIGYQPIIDFHVPYYNNYFCAGIVHHNCGKTIAGSYQTALHLTGLYPSWWEGKRFQKEVSVCCAGDTNESTRDIIQKELFGEVEGVRGGKRWVSGTGMIPLDCIHELYWKSGVQNMIDYAIIKHVGGGLSRVVLKTYAQGRKLFQGTAYHVVWFDEEPPEDVYGEALTRTATTGGIAYLTFTPLQGVSKTIQLFLPEGHVKEYNDGVRAVVNMTWDDAPHLDERAKKELIESFPPHMRDARTKGLPALGSGAVFPVSEENILVDDFEIPPYWPRAYGFDVGWNWNACVWGAWNPDTGVMYLTSELKLSHVEPETFAAAIKARGEWMNGVIDPASQGSSQFDGRKLYAEYQKLGLKISPADNAVEAGIFSMFQGMVGGRFKVFRSCREWLKEFRLYQRDDKGRIKKENDHGIDGSRYLWRSGVNVASVNPAVYGNQKQNVHTEFNVLD